MADPSELVRITRSRDGHLRLGPESGRGAWLCAGSAACFERAIRRRALGRALRTAVTDAELGELRARLLEAKRRGTTRRSE